MIKGGLAFPERETESERERNNCLLISPLHLGSALNPRTDCRCLSEAGRRGANVRQILHEGEERINECNVLRASDSQRGTGELVREREI